MVYTSFLVQITILYGPLQERIKGGGGEERVTAHPGCGLGESVALCLNMLFTVDRRLTARCSSECHHHCTHY